MLLLNNTRVTDAGLPYLTRLTNLHLLSLERTRVSDERVAHSKKPYPKPGSIIEADACVASSYRVDVSSGTTTSARTVSIWDDAFNQQS